MFALVEAITPDIGHMRYQFYYEDRYVKRNGTWLFSHRVIRKTFPPEVVVAPESTCAKDRAKP